MQRLISILTALAMLVSLTNPFCACRMMAGDGSVAEPARAACHGGHHTHHHETTAPAEPAEMAIAPVGLTHSTAPQSPADPICKLHSGSMIANFATGTDLLPLPGAVPVASVDALIVPTCALPSATRSVCWQCDQQLRADRPLLRQHCALIS